MAGMEIAQDLDLKFVAGRVFLDDRIDPTGLCVERISCLPEALTQAGRRDRFQQGDELVAEAIAQMFLVEITGILLPSKGMFHRKG